MSEAVVPGDVAAPKRPSGVWWFAKRHPTLVAGSLVLALMVLAALLAPLLSGDPRIAAPSNRLLPPSAAHFFGTDHLGREIFSRTLHGARVSLLVGAAVAVIAVAIGLTVGMLAGYVRWIDAVVMRFMDGLMAIPAILLAIAMVALSKGGVITVIVAIAIPEIPRVVRLVRSVVLSVRERPYVDAAITNGSPFWKILIRHVLPSTIAPIIVQATYIAASAILLESGLSFLGAGTPPEFPTWGNMIAESRLYLTRAPWTILFPGVALAVAVLAVNMVGDGLRDRLDPRLARRM